MRRSSLRQLILSAMFAAIIAVAAQVYIAVGPVPFTLQTVAVFLTGTILGKRDGTLAVVVYLLLGAVGVPVFAKMGSGVGSLFGPTGGYLLAFVPAAFLIGWAVETFGTTAMVAVVANIGAALLVLAAGTVWMKVVTGYSWPTAFAGGMAPFILPDLLKAVACGLLATSVRKRLLSARLLTV